MNMQAQEAFGELIQGSFSGPGAVVNTVIVGGGPAGLAPLISAARVGALDEVVSAGLVVVDGGETIGAGAIGRYGINSDSTAETFLSCLKGADPRLAGLLDHPLSVEVAAYGKGAVPLPLVGAFMDVVGAVLHRIVAENPRGSVLTGHQALHVRQRPDGLLETTLRDLRTGTTKAIVSNRVVLATGGHQPLARVHTENVAGSPLLPLYASKLVQSGDVLSTRGMAEVQQRLARCADPRVAIVGGSTSAIATAHALLHNPGSPAFGERAVTVLHRRPLRVFYQSAEAALAEGYDEFGPEDICPISGFVFRLGGFRTDSRELVMRARGIGGRPPEPRLALQQLRSGDDPASRGILERADLIVSALGYRPLALPVLDIQGEPVALFAEGPTMAPLVDSRCRILDASGAPIPGLLGIGLAAGFVPSGGLGGERSFVGQANGLWLWQNDIGALITDAIRQPAVPGVGDRLLELAAQ